MKKNQIPNFLTILRLIMIPFVIIFILIPPKVLNDGIYSFANNTVYWTDLVAFFLFVIASLTDLIDGYLARKWKVESDFGKLWDPIADKGLINATIICMVITNNLPIIFVLIFILRDLSVDALRMVNTKKGIVIAADKWGKLKTIFQMIGLAILFLIYPSYPIDYNLQINGIGFFGYDYQNYWYYVLTLIPLLISVFFSIYSGINYFKKSYQEN